MENETQEVAKRAPAEEQPSDVLAPPAGGSEFIKNLPLAARSFFQKPPLLHHEDRNQYDALQRAVEAEIAPRDLIEFFWVRDFTDLTWEIERNRRLRKSVLEGAELEAVRAIMRVRVDDGTKADLRAIDAMATQLAKKWYEFDRQQGYDLDDEGITGQAFCQRSREIDQLEKQITTLESRRYKVLRELESRRHTLEVRAQLMQVARRAQDYFNSQTTGGAFEGFAKRKNTTKAQLLPKRKSSTRRPRRTTGTDQG
jgi:hypothetical protein